MKKVFMIDRLGSLAFLALIGGVASCGDDAPAQPDGALPVDAPVDAPGLQAITLHFAPVVGAAPFACGQTYLHAGTEDTTITPRDFRFYVQDVELLGAGGTRTTVELDQDAWQYQTLALLDFEDFTGGCADGTPETNLTIRGKVPPGTYTGVAFTIGVPEALNHQDLTSLPTPLNISGLWWSWNLGHIFLAAVSHAEITTPTPGTNDHYVHVGSTECVGEPSMGETVTCAKPNRPHIELTGFDPTITAIQVDYGAVLSGSALTTSLGCHSFDAPSCAMPFSMMGLDFATGHAGTTQAVFRTP
ncbi:MAG: metallo-mystery pair system four-Cys motif protein [Proteobacteria bacterium]|nr:metallo-mystery pair system four-Cys motif protein [Pseudomonadota bacterium]